MSLLIRLLLCDYAVATKYTPAYGCVYQQQLALPWSIVQKRELFQFEVLIL